MFDAGGIGDELIRDSVLTEHDNIERPGNRVEEISAESSRTPSEGDANVYRFAAVRPTYSTLPSETRPTDSSAIRLIDVESNDPSAEVAPSHTAPSDIHAVSREPEAIQTPVEGQLHHSNTESIFLNEIFRTGIWDAIGICDYLPLVDVASLGQTCRLLREICHEEYLLRQVFAESSLKCQTIAQRNPLPELPETESRTLFPVVARVQGSLRRCVPFGRLVYETKHPDNSCLSYRFPSFEPVKLEFFSTSTLAPFADQWELRKLQGNCRSCISRPGSKCSRRVTVLPGEAFYRFEDSVQLADPDRENDCIPFHIFYKRYNMKARLHAVSIPLMWLIHRMSSDEQNGRQCSVAR
jgi:hypothetical protein